MALREILDRKQLTTLFDNSYPDRVHIWIKNICAVTDGAHELGMDEFGVRALRDILGKPREMKADLLYASRETGFAPKPVLGGAVFGHYGGVTPRSYGQRFVPPQGGQAQVVPCLIDGSEQVAFGANWP